MHFLCPFCEAAGLTRTSGGLFKVRMSNSVSGSRGDSEVAVIGGWLYWKVERNQASAVKSVRCAIAEFF